MKARIYIGENDHQGQVLDGEVVEFYLGTHGWNITLRGGENHKKFLGLFEIIQTQTGEILMSNFSPDPDSRLVIQKDGTEWIGFKNGTARVQIF
jgi:hypothetical protein